MVKIQKSLVLFIALVALLVLAGCSAGLPQIEDPAQAGVATTAAAAEAATATVNARSLRVRADASDTGEVIGAIKQGESYSVLQISTDGAWVQLAVDSIPGGVGWVAASYITVDGLLTGGTQAEAAPILEATATPVAEAPVADADALPASTVAAGFALVNTDGTRLRVRAEASADSAIAGYVYDGETYQVLETNADGQWVKISGSQDSVSDNPNGGWVKSEFLTIGQ